MPKHERLIKFGILCFIVAALLFLDSSSVAPPTGDAAIWFNGGLFALIIAASWFEYKFTKPDDVVVNCVLTFVAVSSLNDPPHPEWWKLLKFYAASVGFLAAIIGLQSEPRTGEVHFYRKLGYGVATQLGKASIIFSFVFLLSLISYFDESNPSTKLYAIAWGAAVLVANTRFGLLIEH